MTSSNGTRRETAAEHGTVSDVSDLGESDRGEVGGGVPPVLPGRETDTGPHETVSGTLERNDAGRMRVGGIRVLIEPVVEDSEQPRMQRCWSSSRTSASSPRACGQA